jgi:hypothetical protein
VHRHHSLRLTEFGLRLLYIALIGSALAQLSTIFFTVVQAQVMIERLIYISIGLGIVGFIGQLLCVSTPDSMPGRAFLFASFFMTMFGIVCVAIVVFMLFTTTPKIEILGGWPFVLSLSLFMWTTVQLAAQIFFLLFVKSIAVYIGQREIERDASDVIIMIVWLLFGLLILGGYLAVTGSSSLITSLFKETPTVAINREFRSLVIAVPAVFGLGLFMLGFRQFYRYIGLIGKLRVALQALPDANLSRS